MYSVAIIIPTHSSYIEEVCIFIKLLRKYWKECPYRIIVSISGTKHKIEGVDVVYNGEKASLIDCLVNAETKYKYDLYMCFLGDALIKRKIKNQTILGIIDEIKKSKAQYCSLNYENNYKKKKLYGKYLRYINSQDRYSHSFVAFIATRDYIKTMSKYKSDLDFELSFLNKDETFYYSNNIYTQAFIRGLREKYPEGTRVRLVSMFDPYNTTLKPGDEGTVTFIDAQGTIFVDWECGSSLGLIYGEDLFEVIE